MRLLWAQRPATGTSYSRLLDNFEIHAPKPGWLVVGTLALAAGVLFGHRKR